MFATILAALVKGLSDSLLQTVSSFIQAEMTKRDLLAQGVAAQAAKETAFTTATVTQEAQTEAQTDRTASGLEKAARAGDF